jgi:hypothetical protein
MRNKYFGVVETLVIVHLERPRTIKTYSLEYKNALTIPDDNFVS